MVQRRIWLSVERRPSSKCQKCSSAEPGGTVHSKWLILPVLRQLRRRCNSARGSSKSPRHDCNSKILPTWVATKDLIKSEVPQTGEPRSSTPPCLSLTRQTSSGNSEKNWSPDGQKTSHFFIFRWRPNFGPFFEICVNRSEMAVRGPTKEPSSRYQSLLYCNKTQVYYIGIKLKSVILE